MEDMSSAPAGAAADAPTTEAPISKRAAKRAAKREERDAELQEKKKQRAAEALMTEREVKSSCQQLMYCYGANRRAAAPSRVLLSGLSGNMAAQMRNINGFESWLATDVEERPLEELFATAADRAQLVYLTAEAEAVLDRPDPAKTYVIGGFVDRNRHKGLTRDKAARLGLATARLPIGADMPIVLGDASKVLTINHVFELLVRVQASGDWADAAACLPGRKQRAGEAAAPQRRRGDRDAGCVRGCGIM
ncbi:tRNA (guanine(9)-N(1))-methyltransferase [Aureococcus anophagefferens]|nr:tRNA (guanine(9)-N(1))-methyltransferase [Aureococcus anophagefferens]